MTAIKASKESFALRLSVAGYAGMAIAGFSFAALTRSGAILLDGAYSLVSLMMALLAGQVVKLLRRDDSESFHFGYAFFEPLLNAIRGLLILAIVALGVGSAVSALLNGGRMIDPGLALIYSAIIGSICFLLSFTQHTYAQQTGSPLLQVDARNWLIDGILTIAIGVAFLVSLFLSWSSWSDWLPYIDPLVVIVVGAVLVPTPLKIVLNNVGQLLHLAPSQEVQTEIRRRIEEATADLSLVKRDVRMFRVGRYFYVLVRLIVNDDFPTRPIADLDRVRERIACALADVEPQAVLDVVFTTDRRWILGLVNHEAELILPGNEVNTPENSKNPPAANAKDNSHSPNAGVQDDAGSTPDQ